MSQPLIVAQAASGPPRHDVKIVVNGNIGQFRLSRAALDLYASRKGFRVVFDADVALRENADGDAEAFSWSTLDRADPDLVRVVEELGEEAWGRDAELRIVPIPDGSDWMVRSICGYEFIEIRERPVAA